MRKKTCLEELYEEFTPEYVTRFLRKLKPVPATDCIIWTGAIDQDGYGILKGPITRSRMCKAHRISYWIFRGPLDDEDTLNHIFKCRNKRCVNPYHLEPASRYVNTALGNIDRLGTEEEEWDDIL